MTGARRFAFQPDLGLEVAGSEVVLRHFDAEYARVLVASVATIAEVRVTFGAVTNEATRIIDGGHKTVSWRVALPAPGERPLNASIELRGHPRSFGLSLLQGYVVEPLVSIAAVDTGSVLLPAAAVVENGGALLMLGRSRSGKSSVCARALAAGRAVLGDDQVFVDSAGQCRAFPRRLRLYSDLRLTAPAAYNRLPASYRAGLMSRKALRRLTGGHVAPPIRVRFEILDGQPPQDPLPLRRAVVIERGTGSRRLDVSDLDATTFVQRALEIVDEQRRMLLMEPSGDWQSSHSRLLAQEQQLLDAAFTGVSLLRVSIPTDWSAARAVNMLAQELGIS